MPLKPINQTRLNYGFGEDPNIIALSLDLAGLELTGQGRNLRIT